VNPFRHRRGFTIIELAIVLTIVGILATIAVYTYGKIVNKARFTQAKIALKHLQKTELIYFTEHDRYTDNVVLIDFDPVDFDYYKISVKAMEGDLWTITPDGVPVQDNLARTLF
jgi:prepilin-type N-terminal cleavage/methylation domain-containing protein